MLLPIFTNKSVNFAGIVSSIIQSTDILQIAKDWWTKTNRSFLHILTRTEIKHIICRCKRTQMGTCQNWHSNMHLHAFIPNLLLKLDVHAMLQRAP